QMAVQPSYRPDEASSFFPDGRAARPAIPGTVARGHLRTDPHLFAGKRTRQTADGALPATLVGLAGGGNPVGALAILATEEGNHVEPFLSAITQPAPNPGQDRYMISCGVCHAPPGPGRAKIVERGYTPPPSFHIERLRRAPVGRFFDVMTNGYGSMPDYKQQIPPRDRWAIAAYIRALQLSQHFPVKELPDDLRAEWDKQQSGGPRQ